MHFDPISQKMSNPITIATDSGRKVAKDYVYSTAYEVSDEETYENENHVIAFKAEIPKPFMTKA